MSFPFITYSKLSLKHLVRTVLYRTFFFLLKFTTISPFFQKRKSSSTVQYMVRPLLHLFDPLSYFSLSPCLPPPAYHLNLPRIPLSSILKEPWSRFSCSLKLLSTCCHKLDFLFFFWLCGVYSFFLIALANEQYTFCLAVVVLCKSKKNFTLHKCLMMPSACYSGFLTQLSI